MKRGFFLFLFFIEIVGTKNLYIANRCKYDGIDPIYLKEHVRPAGQLFFAAIVQSC